MEIILYNDNLSYDMGMCDFITKSGTDRTEILSQYPQGQQLEVEEFASGSTCICYQIKTVGPLYGQIVKHYSPQALINSQELYVESGSVFIDKKADPDEIKGEYDRFLKTTNESVRQIHRHYTGQDINMFVNPRIALTNLGYVFICEKTGDTLQNSYNSLLSEFQAAKKNAKDFLTELLKKSFRTLLTIQRVQESDYLLLDVKPQNLCTVTGDTRKEDWGVRVIDFGSSLSMEDFIGIIKEKSSIRYRYLSSNQKYYSQKDFDDLSLCNDEDVKEKAKWLDYKAMLNIILDCLICATRGDASLACNTASIDILTHPSIIQEFLTKYSISTSVFEMYHIYRILLDIYKERSIEQILIKFTKLLSILQENIFWEFAEQEIQQRAIMFNKIFKKKDKELGFKKKSFKEFLECCKKCNYSNFSVQDLYWHLLCGINCGS